MVSPPTWSGRPGPGRNIRGSQFRREIASATPLAGPGSRMGLVRQGPRSSLLGESR
jgi:hypothetical protein